jgi:type I site-specific restriction endonuclease
MGIPHEWVRTKEYMEPTDIDKSAGKRYGYIPDYSVWRNGFPLLIVEAKPPDDAVKKALREAQLYASRINNRYPRRCGRSSTSILNFAAPRRLGALFSPASSTACARPTTSVFKRSKS